MDHGASRHGDSPVERCPCHGIHGQSSIPSEASSLRPEGDAVARNTRARCPCHGGRQYSQALCLTRGLRMLSCWHDLGSAYVHFHRTADPRSAGRSLTPSGSPQEAACAIERTSLSSEEVTCVLYYLFWETSGHIQRRHTMRTLILLSAMVVTVGWASGGCGLLPPSESGKKNTNFADASTLQEYGTLGETPTQSQTQTVDIDFSPIINITSVRMALPRQKPISTATAS